MRVHQLLAFVLVTFCVLQSSAFVTPAASADEVTHLPNLYPQPSFKHYSGFIPVEDANTANNTRNMHYWFVESQGSPASDPVMLWVSPA